LNDLCAAYVWQKAKAIIKKIKWLPELPPKIPTHQYHTSQLTIWVDFSSIHTDLDPLQTATRKKVLPFNLTERGQSWIDHSRSRRRPSCTKFCSSSSAVEV